MPAAALKWPDAQVLHAIASGEDAAASLRYLPAPHTAHAAWASRFWNRPCAHVLHALASTSHAPALLRNLPAAQATHETCAQLGWKRPAPQALQATDSAKDADSFVSRNFPALHFENSTLACEMGGQSPWSKEISDLVGA